MNEITVNSIVLVINNLKKESRKNGNDTLLLTSKDIHKIIGGYSNGNTRYPMCCNAMKKAMKNGDEILFSTPSGQSSTFKVKYYL